MFHAMSSLPRHETPVPAETGLVAVRGPRWVAETIEVIAHLGATERALRATATVHSPA